MKSEDIATILSEGYDVELLQQGFYEVGDTLELDYLFVDTHPAGVGTNYAECQAGQAFELVDLWQDDWGFLAIANEHIGVSAIGKFKTRWFTLLSSSTLLPEKLALPWIDNFCPHASSPRFKRGNLTFYWFI